MPDAAAESDDIYSGNNDKISDNESSSSEDEKYGMRDR